MLIEFQKYDLVKKDASKRFCFQQRESVGRPKQLKYSTEFPQFSSCSSCGLWAVNSAAAKDENLKVEMVLANITPFQIY